MGGAIGTVLSALKRAIIGGKIRESSMPMFRRGGGVEIYYQEYGTGFPILLFAPGGLRSAISFWRPREDGQPRPWMDPTVELASRYRVIAMDQRNAERSRAPIHAGDGWQSYADDHIALLDHLGVARCHLMGGCIGSSFNLTLCQTIPERIAAAILQNPIGHDETNDNRYVFAEMLAGWGKSMRERDPGLGQETVDSFGRNMFGGDFAFSVTRDFVRRCQTPLLVMPGDDPPHPAYIGEEIAKLAPKAEVLRDWKGPAHLAAATEKVKEFLQRHDP
jgi:pimeloyl-ACP methyl ester carboxylesterase